MSTLQVERGPSDIVLPDSRPPSALAALLQQRRSQRTFAARPLELDHLAALLWSAFGINRKDSAGRTAPSARDWQETTVYAVLGTGAYRYEPTAHRLVRAGDADVRAATGMQDFVASAPLNLVYVADLDNTSDVPGDDMSFLLGCDAGCIAQNVYLCCAALGLATVVRGLIDRKRLAAALGLRPRERITLAQSVGYAIS